jgi:hypothetical protein
MKRDCSAKVPIGPWLLPDMLCLLRVHSAPVASGSMLHEDGQQVHHVLSATSTTR